MAQGALSCSWPAVVGCDGVRTGSEATGARGPVAGPAAAGQVRRRRLEPVRKVLTGGAQFGHLMPSG